MFLDHWKDKAKKPYCNLNYMSAATQESPLENKIKVVDMQKEMIGEAFSVAKEALALHEIDREIAKHIKKHFDTKY